MMGTRGGGDTAEATVRKGERETEIKKKKN